MVSPSFLFEVAMHIEVLEEIDHKKILEEANTVKVMSGKGWANIGQVGIQGHKPNLDPMTEYKSSIGRVSKLQYPETYFKYSLFEIPTINRLMEKYGMLRTRIMQSTPKTCLSFHQDMSII